ncbi:MAG TPA: DUF3370 family protein, partial [Candidatus Obscuribacterales bacterium]
MRVLLRLSTALSLCLLASQLMIPAQAQTSLQVQSLQPITVYPLPGSLDNQPMLNSNNPEIVKEAGILVSTLPPERTSERGNNDAFLDYAFEGDFGFFAHHFLEDQNAGEHMLYLGLVATNLSDEPVKLTLKQGASYLSQPDAQFRDLPSFASNPAAMLYAGPGDRVASELIAGKAQYHDTVIEIPPQSSQLISSLPVNSNVAASPPKNGRSTLMHFHSDGPVYLSHLAWFARKEGASFVPPTLEDYQSLLFAGKIVGDHDESSNFNPAEQPPKDFSYWAAEKPQDFN